MAASKANNPYKAAMDALNTYLLDHDMRMTPVRAIVLNEMCQLPQPFTAEQLQKACSEERVSKGTVYNTLNLMLKANILHIREKQRGHIVSEYEFATTPANRMQIVCTKCGRTKEVHDKAIARLLLEKKFTNFDMRHYSLIVYGECRICPRKRLTRK